MAADWDPFRFLEVVAVDELPAAFKTPRFPSLLELAARVLSRNKPGPDEWAGLGQSQTSQIRDAFPAELRHEVMASCDCPVCGTPAVTECESLRPPHFRARPSRRCPCLGTLTLSIAVPRSLSGPDLEVIQFVPMGRADAKVPTPARLCSAKCRDLCIRPPHRYKLNHLKI